LPRRVFDARAAEGWEATGEVVLATPRANGRSPFLAQYLAQEFTGPGEDPARWRERDNAYRLAGLTPTEPRLSLDV
jgi:hypothetical protein